jgi:predicted alpha/beta-hydrolase family hydrolase
MILQGERDSFGKPEEVATFSLFPAVQVAWIPSGDRSFRPTLSDGFLRRRI